MTPLPADSSSPDRSHETGGGVSALESWACAATRAAALACEAHVGRGDPKAADSAATEAMRTVLGGAPGIGTVVIGEGEKDSAPMLFNGERLGTGAGPEFDIAVDPLECTNLCANGLPGALATIAVAETGALMSPGPAFYMDKLVVPPAARAAIDITEPLEANLQRVAQALGKRVDELRVVVLDKPRHEELVAGLHAAGARVALPTDGDVGGALAVLLPDGDADVTIGIGGTPEGVMTACAAAALGGGMQGRLAPQDEDEARAVAEAGLDTGRVYELDELVTGEALFVATGVSGGQLLRAPWREGGQTMTESIVVAAGSVRRIAEGAAGRKDNPEKGD